MKLARERRFDYDGLGLVARGEGARIDRPEVGPSVVIASKTNWGIGLRLLLVALVLRIAATPDCAVWSCDEPRTETVHVHLGGHTISPTPFNTGRQAARDTAIEIALLPRDDGRALASSAQQPLPIAAERPRPSEHQVSLERRPRAPGSE